MGVYLKVPSKDEIKFRQELMRDPKTMSYNKDYDLDINGYHKDIWIIFNKGNVFW